jgi:hypothetical protein
MDDDFCNYLESQLSKAFRNSSDKQIKWYWCDGVKIQSNLNQQDILETKVIYTDAWLGLTGQEDCKMVIHLGERALDNYQKSLSLIDCVPSSESTDWFTFTGKLKIIEVYLK